MIKSGFYLIKDIVICWICGISAFAGFMAMYMTVTEKIKNDTNRRDEAIKEIFEQHCFKE